MKTLTSSLGAGWEVSAWVTGVLTASGSGPSGRRRGGGIGPGAGREAGRRRGGRVGCGSSTQSQAATEMRRWVVEVWDPAGKDVHGAGGGRIEVGGGAACVGSHDGGGAIPAILRPYLAGRRRGSQAGEVSWRKGVGRGRIEAVDGHGRWRERRGILQLCNSRHAHVFSCIGQPS
jgi:hypothetical protein